jgi:hypothetical protein
MMRSASASVLSVDIARSIVQEALEGKYDGLDAASLDLALRRAWRAAGGVGSEDGLKALLAPVDGPGTDVRNHVVVLHLIERFWRHQPILRRSITAIHDALCGLGDGGGDIRQTSFVEDFGAEVPTNPTDVRGALTELELTVAALAPLFSQQTTRNQAMFLAFVFASVIRVHPFADGNGRAARFTVQYCLRLWNRGYVALPKVRNDPAWRLALSEAIGGRLDLLADEFVGRMK